MPSLATSSQVSGLTTWDFDIRDGVRFHGGTPLMPDDVVFSLERACANRRYAAMADALAARMSGARPAADRPRARDYFLNCGQQGDSR
jgi:ABC-type transport system substrate-binding protein